MFRLARLGSVTAALLAVMMVASACTATDRGEAAASSDLVMTLDGDDLALFAPSDKPRVLWFWGPY